MAQEHVAAYITDRLVTTVSGAGTPPARHHGSIVVACPTGEWHALPARLVAEVLQLHGWRIEFLGANVPPSELSHYLGLRKPDALLLSVTLPGNLPQAHRCLQAARKAGVPSLIGGRGIGANGRYASQMAADAWAADALSAATVLSQWPPRPSTAPRTTNLTEDGEYAVLDQGRWQLIDSILDSFRLELTLLRRHWATRMDETIAELNYLLDFLAAAVYLDDHTIFTDFIDWLRQLRTAHHWPPEPVHVALATLSERLHQQPRTRGILAAGQQRLTATPAPHNS
ncbi:cobalamin B12-binding domain-containing protein [Actinoplanes sp. NPDC023801]|uniref:cobalamin B12-binding domain-containing protein n=1 Tax=Actinoplanes sp. NPDC023801 TaxID=3154595 RepID=UPI0033FB16CC